MEMFEFLSDFGNYEDRKVGRYDADGLIVSTAAVSDGMQPYETAICHSEYNDRNPIIVEGYDSRSAAQEGHDKWVKLMTDVNLPEQLIDCINSGTRQLLGGKIIYQKRVA